jgi:hypothetical protein
MWCNYSLNCKYFGKCGFIHTPLEKEFYEFKQNKLSTKDIDLDLLPPPLEDIDLDLLPPPLEDIDLDLLPPPLEDIDCYAYDLDLLPPPPLELELEFDINSFIIPPIDFDDVDDTKIFNLIKQQSLELYAEKRKFPTKKMKKFIVKKKPKKNIQQLVLENYNSTKTIKNKILCLEQLAKHSKSKMNKFINIQHALDDGFIRDDYDDITRVVFRCKCRCSIAFPIKLQSLSPNKYLKFELKKLMEHFRHYCSSYKTDERGGIIPITKNTF